MRVDITKIKLNFGGSDFHIDLEEEFATYLTPQLKELFQTNSSNEIKVLLQAFVKKSHDLYELKNSIKKNIIKLQELEDR